jgi:hypothetical protein
MLENYTYWKKDGAYSIAKWSPLLFSSGHEQCNELHPFAMYA